MTRKPTTEAKKLLNFASIVDINTIAQAIETSQMPFVHPHVALMPDAHFGKGSAVGTVIPTLGVVIPAAVGVDIGCGMIAVETTVTESDLANLRPERTLAGLRADIEAAIPLSPGNYNDDTRRFDFTADKIAELDRLATESEVDLTHSPKWREQLGSLGGGNHFIELTVDERSIVWLFLHSGSRGVGNKIAQRHIKVAQGLNRRWWIDLPNPDLAYLVEGTPEFKEYLADLTWAQRFAYLNRAEMMDRFVNLFAQWSGTPFADIETSRINTHHNYTVQENHGGQNVWLTRKGAIDAHEGVMGLIPGSMGTKSYVVRGKGSTAGLCSAPHGAGRVFSRTEAKKRFTIDDLRARMVGIEYRESADFIDEIPDAYKDVDQVIDDAGDLVEVVHTLRQLLNVKGT